MLLQLETSGDFTLPEAGVPVMLNPSSGHEEAGLQVWVHPQTATRGCSWRQGAAIIPASELHA